MSFQELIGGRVGLVFPGQGSQFVGMGRSVYEWSPAARTIFDEADVILGFSLTGLCFEGPGEELEDTLNAQPAILTVSLANLAALNEKLAEVGEALTPAVVAGHSLGEFTALVAAGVLDFPEALRLVRERGRLMKAAGDERPGGMAAVIGLDDDILAEVCAEAAQGGIIVVANANCPGQTVISGEVEPLLRAMDLAKARGARRVARLGISIASHSPLMAETSRRLGDVLAEIPLRAPKMPVVANGSGEAMTTVEEIRAELAHHVERAVNWTQSVRTMVADGATSFVEVGPGNVLSGLIRRIRPEARTFGLGDLGLDLPALEKPGRG